MLESQGSDRGVDADQHTRQRVIHMCCCALTELPPQRILYSRFYKLNMRHFKPMQALSDHLPSHGCVESLSTLIGAWSTFGTSKTRARDCPLVLSMGRC